MFEYLPFFDRDATDEQAKEIQFRFFNHVHDACEKYTIDDSSVVTVILDCCDKLEELINTKKADIWPSLKKEPIEEFQDLLQLLGYAISDDDFLFTTIDELKNTYLEKNPKEVWKAMADRQNGLIEAFYNRDNAYRELIKIRRQLQEQEKRGTIFEGMPDDDSDVENRYSFVSNRYRNVGVFQLDPEQRVFLLNTCTNNRLLIKLAPLYLCFAITTINETVDAEDGYYETEEFVKALKENKRMFKSQKGPADISYSNRLCRCFDEIMAASFISSGEMYGMKRQLFDPYIIINDIERKTEIEVSIEDKVKIAAIARSTFLTPKNKDLLREFGPKLNDTSLGELMYYFLVVFSGFHYNYMNAKHEKPRGLDTAIKTIYSNLLGNQTEENPNYQDRPSENQYQMMLKRILENYFYDTYDMCEEMFWLITGYIPPWTYSYEHREHSLYALIDFYLEKHYVRLNNKLLCNEYELASVRYSFELRSDIVKLRSLFSISKESDKKGIERVETFLRKVASVESEIYSLMDVEDREKKNKELRNYCISEYLKIVTEKTRYKSGEYALNDVYPNVIIDELLIQSWIYLRRRIYSLIISFSKYIWPLDYKDKGNKMKEGDSSQKSPSPD